MPTPYAEQYNLPDRWMPKVATEGASIDTDLLWTLLCSAAAFFVVFLVSRTVASLTGYLSAWNVDPKLWPEWHSRVVSTFHALVAVGMFAYLLVADARTLGSIHDAFQATFVVSALRSHFVFISGGYLFYDFLLCLWYKKEMGDVMTLAHHVVVLGGLLLVTSFGIGTWFLLLFFPNELSTPFTNLRCFLLYTGRRHSFPYKVNGVILIVVFFCCRVLVLSVICWQVRYVWTELMPMYTDALTWELETPLFQLLGWRLVLISCLPLPLWLLNVVWWYKIVRYYFSRVFVSKPPELQRRLPELQTVGRGHAGTDSGSGSGSGSGGLTPVPFRGQAAEVKGVVDGDKYPLAGLQSASGHQSENLIDSDSERDGLAYGELPVAAGRTASPSVRRRRRGRLES